MLARSVQKVSSCCSSAFKSKGGSPVSMNTRMQPTAQVSFRIRSTACLPAGLGSLAFSRSGLANSVVNSSSSMLSPVYVHGEVSRATQQTCRALHDACGHVQAPHGFVLCIPTGYAEQLCGWTSAKLLQDHALVVYKGMLSKAMAVSPVAQCWTCRPCTHTGRSQADWREWLTFADVDTATEVNDGAAERVQIIPVADHNVSGLQVQKTAALVMQCLHTLHITRSVIL